MAGFAYGVVNDRLVVAGGTEWLDGAKRISVAVHEFDPASGTWQTAQPLPQPFAYGVFCTWQNALHLFGGTDGSTAMIVGLPEVAGRHNSLQPRNPRPHSLWRVPPPLAYAGHALILNRLFILGGTPDIHNLAALTSNFQSINLVDGTCERLPPYPAGPVLHAAMVPIGHTLFVFPGGTLQRGTNQIRNTQSAYRYNITARTWACLAQYPFPIRGLGACALDSDHILIVGGERTRPYGPTDRSFVYDVAKDCYLPLPRLPYAAMLIGVQPMGSWVYLFGGEDAPKQRSNAVCRARISSLLRAANLGAAPAAPECWRYSDAASSRH